MFGTLGTIEYLYNSIGQKVQKKVTNGAEITLTDYLDGFQYQKAAVWAPEVLDFLPHAEGYVKNTRVRGVDYYNYAFNYTDHLGNVRLTYGLNRGVPVILEENHYYPYGLKHQNYNVSSKQYNNSGGEVLADVCTNCSYKYKYNGKEYQDELGLNMTAMDMRMFDSAIARWVVQDPIVHHSQSQYNGFDGNPVFFADPSGGDSIGNPFSGLDVLGRNKFDNQGVYISPNNRGSARPEILNMINDFNTIIGNITGFNGTKVQDLDFNIRIPISILVEKYTVASASNTVPGGIDITFNYVYQYKFFDFKDVLKDIELLKDLYTHFQIGGGQDYHIKASSIDLSGTTQSELGLDRIGINQTLDPVNLFTTGINANSLAFGQLVMTRVSETQFSIAPNNFDFDYKSGATWERNAGTILAGVINYNLLFFRGAAALIPLLYGGPFKIVFEGTVTIPK